MKLLPSIAFSDFSGSAGNVTARKRGDKTVLSTRTKHSRKKTRFQASTRCRFTDTVRGFSRITEAQRQGWFSLARNLGNYSTSTGKTAISGHNLYVAINTYRRICGKPPCADPPATLKPSRSISYGDFWISPGHIEFTAIGNRENPNEVLHVAMYPAPSPAETGCWNKTVCVAIFPDTNWGDIDITRAFIKKFGAPLAIGQKVFITICWLDSECGYLKNFSQFVFTARETSILGNAAYRPRAKITMDDIIPRTVYSKTERCDYEFSNYLRITSNEIVAERLEGETAQSCNIPHKGLSSDFNYERSFQYARGTEEENYIIHYVCVIVLNSVSTRIHISMCVGMHTDHINTFGTYCVTK